MTPYQRLKKKQKEVEQEVRQWAAEENVTTPHETVVCTLRIVPKSNVPQRRRKKCQHTDKKITERHWQHILSLPWSNQQRALIDVFREHNNQPCLPHELGIRVWSQIEQFNVIFRRYAKPYRLSYRGRTPLGMHFHQKPIEFIIVE